MEEHMYCYPYPHPAVTTDCIVFGFDGRELKVLLIERGIEPFKGCWAFPGGFIRMEEDAVTCALRELREETGMKLLFIKEFGTFSDIQRDPRERVISIAFYALAKKQDVQGGDDAAKAQWFALHEVPKLAFDHDLMLKKALQKLKEDIHFEPIGFDLLGESFTMPELQRLYEAILGVQFDRRNFYKKMLQTGILNELDEEEKNTSFFGEHKEMRTMSIDALFETSSANIFPQKPLNSEESRRKKGTRFSFNKKRYNEFKENNNFRLEF